MRDVFVAGIKERRRGEERNTIYSSLHAGSHYEDDNFRRHRTAGREAFGGVSTRLVELDGFFHRRDFDHRSLTGWRFEPVYTADSENLASTEDDKYVSFTSIIDRDHAEIATSLGERGRVRPHVFLHLWNHRSSILLGKTTE